MPQYPSNSAKTLMRTLLCIGPDATIAEAAKAMKKADTGSIFVGEADRPVGIITERDIARRVVAEGIDPQATPVKKMMTRKMRTADVAESLGQVFQHLARGHQRHLPITEQGRIVGIISLTDIFNILKEMYKDEEFLKDFSGDAE